MPRTRQTGGNPLASADRTACRKAGIEGNSLHPDDWRHHFAVWFLKSGGAICGRLDCSSLWSSMRMVTRYAVFEQSDLDAIMTTTARSNQQAA